MAKPKLKVGDRVIVQTLNDEQVHTNGIITRVFEEELDAPLSYLVTVKERA